MAAHATRTKTLTISSLIADRSIRAFIFDVDGVIADTADLHVDAWRRAVREQGIEFPEKMSNCVRGESRRRSLELILGDRSIEPSRFDAIMERKNALYVDSLDRLTAGDRLAGSFDFVTWLRESGIKIAAASASANARRVLELIGAMDWFDTTVDGNDERKGGGNHRFLMAAARMMEKPANCCVVEDSIANIQVARRLGMCTLGVGPASVSELPDLAVSSLAALNTAVQLRSGCRSILGTV